MKPFKIRASACGQIMTNDRSGKGMGKTAKEYCETWLKEQIYGRRKQIDSKFMTKGTLQEDDAIDLVAEQLGLGLILKNDKYFSNVYCTGTPDVILPGMIIDVKCSWDCFTFPVFQDAIDKSYYLQGQVYMWLTGREHYKLCYCLMDTPQHLIEREARYRSADTGEDYDDLLPQLIKHHSYSDVDARYRLRVFDFGYDQSVIEQIIERVGQCREYIETLKTKL